MTCSVLHMKVTFIRVKSPFLIIPMFDSILPEMKHDFLHRPRATGIKMTPWPPRDFTSLACLSRTKRVTSGSKVGQLHPPMDISDNWSILSCHDLAHRWCGGAATGTLPPILTHTRAPAAKGNRAQHDSTAEGKWLKACAGMRKQKQAALAGLRPSFQASISLPQTGSKGSWVLEARAACKRKAKY